MSLHRRHVLGLGALGLGVGVARAWPRRRAADLDELARELGRVPRDELSQWIARRAAQGLTPDEVLGASFLLGLREIRTGPVGNQLHSVMVVESVWRMTADASSATTWEAVLWLADDVRDGMQRDARGPDWTLAALKPSARDVAGARSELRLALEAFDPERAERAAATLHARGAAQEALDVLRAYAGRSLTDAGHRVIHFAQCERALARIGARHAEPVLRSLAVGLAGDDDANSATWHAARELAPELPEDWERGAEAPERSAEVLAAVRGRTPAEAREAVRAALADGLGTRTVWDGLRLYAAELFWLRPDRQRIFPVHTTTELEALAWCYETSRDENLRRALVLQAPAWLVQVRERIVDNNGAYAEGPTFERLPESDATLEEALVSRSTPEAVAALERDPARVPEFVGHLRDDLVPRARQNHQQKFLAALQEELARCHPRWRARIVAPAIDFLPAAAEPESDFGRRARAALSSAGV